MTTGREHHPDPVAAEGLRLSASATAAELPGMRVALKHWLGSQGVPDELVSDVVLCTSEALTNAIVHAYRDHVEPGRMDLVAEHVTDMIIVSVTDHGDWHEPSNTAIRVAGGWGIPMMRECAEAVTITHPDGTQVSAHYRLP